MIINKENIKKFSVIPFNFNLDDLLNFVEISEFKWVRPLLGEELFDEIQEQVENNELSEQNATLLTDGGLWRYLCQCIVYEYLPYNYLHFNETGVNKGFSESSESATLKDITYLTSHVRAQIENFKKFTYNWLLEREDSFPKWMPSDDCGCAPPPTRCCNNNTTFHKPEPLKVVYGFKKKNIDIK